MAKKTKAKAQRRDTKAAGDDLVGKRVQFDRTTWDAVDLLAREQMKDLPEITEEAFRDLLKKYGRSADFRETLKMSARRMPKR
ncbi:MAG: hypothetical protein Q8M24_00995 [Pseudolabrys sp.]|nr:hypothetical protein [Pseudolabrys sp.]MDP2294023.1 hypothetical protein [Pseudolabrys sp.]